MYKLIPCPSLDNEQPAALLPHAPHHNTYPSVVPELPALCPSITRPKQRSKLPSKYLDYTDSQSIVNQLLQLDDEEASIPLPNDLSTLPHILSDISTADSILNVSINDGLTNKDDPPTVHHAQCSKFWGEWLAAIHKELEALKAKGVYKDITKLPPNKKAVQCKWVLHIKCDKDGQISRFKACLVAKGFTQVFG